MKKLDKNQKRIVLIAAAGLVLYLLYRYHQAQQANAAGATGTGVPATDTAASDYASLAGQEQGDVASLQQQEQGDIATLQQQEQGDIGGLTSSIGDVQTAITGLTTTVQGQDTSIAAIATGEQQINRQLTKTAATHKGGPFYNYYVRVTGHPPPAQISVGNFVYQAWKSGVKATALGAPRRHPSSRNEHIAHPNHNHTEKRGTHHKLKTGARKAPPRTNRKSGRRR